MYRAKQQLVSNDSLNSVSKFAYSDRANSSLGISCEEIGKDTSEHHYKLSVSLGQIDSNGLVSPDLNYGKNPTFPWPMSSKLVRYRVRDDTFNTSGPWSVVGVFYPLPKLNWWYKRKERASWNLVKTVDYVDPEAHLEPGALQPMQSDSPSLYLYKKDVPPRDWFVVASFSSKVPPVTSKYSRDFKTEFDKFSTPVFKKV